MHQVHTSCRICAATCGITATVEAGRVSRIEQDQRNPHTWRDFCPKGRTAADALEHPQRITTPMRRVRDRYVPATYVHLAPAAEPATQQINSQMGTA